MVAINKDFQEAFERLHAGHAPFAWQERLFQQLCRGEFPSALDLPTGLGKTSVMAIWLLARALSGDDARKLMPRRLVYIVDRRAVVDQATSEAKRLRDGLECDAKYLKTSLGLGDRKLPISTLRGQHIDNRKWLADPTTSAIVVGTVDMIGARLLFSGYGVSPKMRPYHAGLLGADTLVVLDEAHLVPPFEALLKTIARDPKSEFAPRPGKGGTPVPGFRLMSLSATGREDEADGGVIFRLSKEDHQHPVVQQRLGAAKRMTLSEAKDGKALVEKLAERAWALGTEPRPARVLVYCNSRDNGALKVKEKLDECAKKAKIPPPELLVGGRRLREREALFKWLETHGFVGERREAQFPTFLIATSAGEVGVDMDADHLVCDLVEWERMVQRLGRVNRRGGDERVAMIEVVAAPPWKEKKDGEPWPQRLKRLRRPIDALNGDASPAAIVALKENHALKEVLQEAQTPAPLRPPLTRALVDAWSMTSLKEHTGRPEIERWLRGWVEGDQPQAVLGPVFS